MRVDQQEQLDELALLIERHHQLVYRLAYRVLRNEADAEDACQEVFLKLARAPASRDDVRDERAWIATVALNVAREQQRSSARRRKREETWAVQHARGEKQIASAISMTEILTAIAALPEQIRLPLELHYQEGFKYDEIARILDWPAGTVASRLSGAREELRARLGMAGVALVVPEMETALRGAQTLSIPAGLRERIAAKVQGELSAIARAPAAPKQVAVHARIAVLLGVAVGLAGVWLGVSQWGNWRGGTSEHTTAANKRSESESLARSTAAPARTNQRSPEGVAGGGDGGGARAAAAPASTRESNTTDQPGSGAVLLVAGGDPAQAAGSGPPEARIFGRVTVAGGQPIADAALALYGPWGKIDETHSNNAGEYEFIVTLQPQERPSAEETVNSLPESLPAEVRELVRTELESQAANEQAAAEPPARIDVSLDVPPVRITADNFAVSDGSVIEAESASVTVPMPAPQGQTEISEQTMQIEDPNCYRVEALTPGHLPQEFPEFGMFNLIPGEEKQADFTLTATDRIAGTVRDAEGTAIAGARLKVIAFCEGKITQEAAALATTDSSGGFAFTSLPRGELLIAVTAPPDFADQEVIVAGSKRDVSVTLQRAGGVHLICTSGQGAPVERVRATLSRGPEPEREGVTDASGELRLQGVSSGHYTLVVEHPGSCIPVLREDLRLKDGETAERNVVLDEGTSICGRVSIAPAVSGLGTWLQVGLYPEEQGDSSFGVSYWERSVKDGTFCFDHVPPGRYQLSLCNYAKSELEGVVALQDIEVRAGEARLECELRVEEVPPGVLEIQACNARGEQIPNFEVSARRTLGGRLIGCQQSRLGEPVRIPGFAGDWSILVKAPGFATRNETALRVEPGRSEVMRVQLEPLGPVAEPGGALFPADAKLQLRAPLSVGAILRLLEPSAGKSIQLSPRLAASEILEQRWWRGAWEYPAGELFDSVLQTCDLRWSAAASTITLDLATP